jgi:hypothetical protein
MNRPHSLPVTLPPLAGIVLKPIAATPASADGDAASEGREEPHAPARHPVDPEPGRGGAGA